MATNSPDFMQWRGPQGLRVRLNEDGVSLHWDSRGGLEQPELLQLIELLNAVMTMRDEGSCPVPQPPSREDLRKAGAEYAGRRLARVAAEGAEAAVKREYGLDDDELVPF